MDKTKPYDWIILFILFISAVFRFSMEINNFIYIDYFIAVINIVGLDYSATNILFCINKYVVDKIDKSNFINSEKKNKKRKHKNTLYICILILIAYSIIHLLWFSCSVGNDMLSMIVLGISITDNSIISFICDKIRI